MEAGRREWRTELRLSIRNLLMVPHPWLLLTQVREAELGRGRLGPVWSLAGSLRFPARPVYWSGAAALSSLRNPRAAPPRARPPSARPVAASPAPARRAGSRPPRPRPP